MSRPNYTVLFLKSNLPNTVYILSYSGRWFFQHNILLRFLVVLVQSAGKEQRGNVDQLFSYRHSAEFLRTMRAYSQHY